MSMQNTAEENIMSMHNTAAFARACRACLGGFLLVILSAWFVEADEYGPRTIIGPYYQQTSTTRSLDGINPSACSNTFGCSVIFQLVPQQQKLLVQHVACQVWISQGTVTRVWLGQRKGKNFPHKTTYLRPVLISSLNGGWWTVNSPAMHLIDSQERPLVSFELSNTATASFLNATCNVSGRIIQLSLPKIISGHTDDVTRTGPG